MTKDLTHAGIALVPIDEITVGLRRRQRLTKIATLAASIAADGLAHPIIVRNGNELVCGARRLAACRKLGWTEIPVRRVEQMTDEEFQRLELHENEARVDLDDYETSKMRMAQIAAEATAKAQEVSSKSDKTSKSKGGRPSKRGVSRAEIAQATEISKTEQIRIEEHVRLAEAYTVLQQPGWKKSTVLAAGKHLEALAPKERPKAIALIEQEPPKEAVKILSKLAEVRPEERARIYASATSRDDRERGDALSLAAKLSPMPDPGLSLLRQVAEDLEKVARVTQVDQVKADLSALSTAAKKIVEIIRAADRERWEQANLVLEPRKMSTEA